MASNMRILLLTYVSFLVLFTVTKGGTAATIGVNWGRVSAQRLVPSMVVDLLLQNNISAARIYTSESDLIQAFAHSGIHLSLTIYTFRSINSLASAREWVRLRNPYFTSSNIRYVYIGNGAIDSRPTINAAINALEWTSQAVNEIGFGNQIKVIIALDQLSLKRNISRPSEAEFVEEYKEEIVKILHILKANNAPFVLDLFPISYVVENNFNPEFAFIDNKSNFVVKDVDGKVYNNVVHFLHDAVVHAMQKVGVPDLDVVIGHIGWPTDGYPGATASSAERFFKGLLPWVAEDRGTPLRPGPIDVYVHSLTDENKMPYFYPFSRHWGIYTSYGEPKYKVDLTGLGRDIYPTRAKGIMKMPNRWCMFNGNMSDAARVKKNFEYSCNKADCTCLAKGGSCSHLNSTMAISYAFNMYFQFQFQDEKSCDFEGLGRVVTEDPSVGGCVFPVDVVRGQQLLSDGNSLQHQMPEYSKMYLFLLSMFWALVWN